jgi:hypothetical protein
MRNRAGAANAPGWPVEIRGSILQRWEQVHGRDETERCAIVGMLKTGGRKLREIQMRDSKIPTSF